MIEIKIGNKKIGGNNPVFIIAELSANHNQDFSIAAKTIKAIKKSGADAVKLQTYTPDTITIDCNNKFFQINQGTIWDGITLYELYKKAYTPWAWHSRLKKLAEKEGLIFFSSPFDKSAADFLEKLKVSVYKIASFEITDIPLIKYVAKKNKPIIISTGIATKDDIKLAVKTCKAAGNSNIAILKCTSSYPAPLEDINLKTMMDMEKEFNAVVGVSDHSLGIEIPIAAVALGAKIIEKHFILDKKIGGPDSEFSLNPEEFQEMVSAVRNVEKSLGKVTYELTDKMKKSREHSRSLFVVEDIKKDEKFTENNIRSIRPGFGMHPKHYEKILGKKSNKNIKKGTPLDWILIK